MALSENELRTLKAIEAQLEADRHRWRSWVRAHTTKFVFLVLVTAAAIAAVFVDAVLAPGPVAAPVCAAMGAATTWLWCHQPGT